MFCSNLFIYWQDDDHQFTTMHQPQRPTEGGTSRKCLWRVQVLFIKAKSSQVLHVQRSKWCSFALAHAEKSGKLCARILSAEPVLIITNWSITYFPPKMHFLTWCTDRHCLFSRRESHTLVIKSTETLQSIVKLYHTMLKEEVCFDIYFIILKTL